MSETVASNIGGAPIGASERRGFSSVGDDKVQSEFSEYMAMDQEKRQSEFVDSIIAEETIAKSALKDLFSDPDKMLKMWLIGETKPNPFSDEQKDPMDNFGKFMQAMLMQTQTGALTDLKETMVKNNKYAATAMLGELVEIETDSMSISSGRQVSEKFTVPKDTAAYGVIIKNAADEVVYQVRSDNPGMGINQFDWSGTDNNGNEVPIGEYKVTIELLQKKSITDGIAPGFERIEYAKNLDGKEINEKVQTISLVDREIQFSYHIPKGIPNMKYATVRIINSKGSMVHTRDFKSADNTKGVYSWNGLDTKGHKLPEDIYTVQITFKDEKLDLIQSEQKAEIRVVGKVEGIEIDDNGKPNLVTSRIKAPLSAVKRVVSENK